MLSYLTKFNNLPEDLRAKVSSPEVMARISELEKAYGVNLAVLVMKVMVKEIAVADLDKYFSFEHGLNAEQAGRLAEEVKEKILFGAADYLGLKAKEDEKALNKWLSERKKETATPVSDFYYSPEDEEEVKALAKRVTNFGAEGENKDKEKADIERIISQAGVTFSANDLKNRFAQVMRTYLIGIRGKIDARETLTKAVVYGGLELSDEFAEKVLKIADIVKSENAPVLNLKPLERIPIAEGQAPGEAEALGKGGRPEETNGKAAQNKYLGRDLAYDFSRLAAAPKKEADANLGQGATKDAGQSKVFSEVQTGPVEARPVKPAGEEAAESGPVDFSSSVEAKPALKKDGGNNNEVMAKAERILKAANIKTSALKAQKIAPPERAADPEKGDLAAVRQTDSAITDAVAIGVAAPRRTKPAEGKVKMDDVKYVPKLMGPVDELKEMDLVNFRRLDSEAEKAAVKIKEKIEFLEDESYPMRLSGIKAWRQSPVIKLYLAIGEESIINKKPISVIIDERKASGREYITSHEFAAIMDLNKELRY